MGILFVILSFYVDSPDRSSTIMTLPTDIVFEQLIKIWEKSVNVALAMRRVTLETPPNGLTIEARNATAMRAIIKDSLIKI